jgi:thioredoxin-like negative regulator of GroEL
VNTHDTQSAPAAMLLIAPGCPHCSGNLSALSGLVKEGVIGRLDIVNIAQYPEVAQELGVRSVPWTRIGDFDLIGAQSETELRRWAGRVNDRDGLAEYFRELLGDGRLAEVQALIDADGERVLAFLPLVEDGDTGVNVRIGIGAVLEDLHGSETAERLVPGLAELITADDSRTRQDACHYLDLTRAAAARPFIERCLRDDDPLVREIAAEALQELDT